MQDRSLDTKHDYAHKLIPLPSLSKVILYLLSDGAETNCGIAHILGIRTDKRLQQFLVYLFWFVFLVTHIT